MSNQDFRRDAADTKRRSEDASERTAQTTKDALAGASSLVEDVADKAKQAANDTAATLAEEVKEILNRQVGRGADTMGYVARSTKRVADDLERDSPQVAGLVRGLASQVDGYAASLRDQSADQLWKAAADFTRKQPALVFGLAALAGFFALRTVKSSPSMSAPSIQPSQPYSMGHSHGS